MILEFISPTNSVDVHVDLLDNPGVQLWANKFLNVTYETVVIEHDHLETRVLDTAYVTHLQSECKKLVADLAKHDIIYSGADIVDINDATSDQMHKWLNQLHRFFTHNSQRCNLRQFPQNTDYSLVLDKLETINYYIHDIELYVPRCAEDLVVDKIQEIKLWQNTLAGTQNWLNLESHRQFHSDQHYHVILTSEVLGKTILQSYLDNDDPNDWDTSGHYASAGGLQICCSNTRQQIYQSNGFKKWLSDNKMHHQDVYYDFPIGNIRDIDKFQQFVHSSNFKDFKKVRYRS
jgi:hypothetical protein